MQVTLPNGDLDVYVFSIAKAEVNGTMDRLQQAIFTKPQTPWGWKHVIENMPMAQAPQHTWDEINEVAYSGLSSFPPGQESRQVYCALGIPAGMTG